MPLVRPISVRDLREVIEIEKQCFEIPWPDSTFVMLAVRKGTAHTREGEIAMVVCEHEERVAGYAVWEYEKKRAEGHLLNIAVTMIYQNQGIGTMLFNYVLDKLRAHNAHRCFLEVRESNHIARQFYEGFGMHPIGRSIAYYQSEDAILYEMEL